MMKLQIPNYISVGKRSLNVREAVEYQIELQDYDTHGVLEDVERKVRKITEFLMVLTTRLYEKGVLTPKDMAELLPSVDVESDQ